MKTHSLEAKIYSKKLVKLSFDDYQLSLERIFAIIKILKINSPKNVKTIFKFYLKYLNREINKVYARLEYAGDLHNNEFNLIKKTIENELGHSVNIKKSLNISLIAGIRIIFSDNIWEQSIASNLQQL